MIFLVGLFSGRVGIKIKCPFSNNKTVDCFIKFCQILLIRFLQDFNIMSGIV
jgi:hypothetical protein